MQGSEFQLTEVLMAGSLAMTAAALEELRTSVYQFFPKVVFAIAILLLTRLAVSIVRRFARPILSRAEPTLRKFLLQGALILTWVVGIVAALNALDIQTATIVTVLGAAGLAVGLALQNNLSHFASGVLLISFRPFEVGDEIEAASVAGRVDEIGLFSTTILTPDHIRITVPNSNLFSGTVKNKSAMGIRRVDLEVDIGDRPITPTIIHLMSLVQPHPLVLSEPKVTCHVASASPKGTVLYLRPWCAAEAYEQVRSEVQQMVRESFLAEVEIIEEA
jgi:small conductance mechanosensitive channel